MFKVIIIDLLNLQVNNNIYGILKKITGYRSLKKIEEGLNLDYSNLINGKISETVFWNSVKRLTKTKRSVDGLRRDLIKHYVTAIDKDAINRIREHFSLVIMCNFFSDWWSIIKKNNGLVSDCDVISSSFGATSPDPTLYSYITNFFKTEPAACMLVSDAVPDIIAARNSGMQTVLISNKDNLFNSSNYRYKNIHDFIEVLL